MTLVNIINSIKESGHFPSIVPVPKAGSCNGDKDDGEVKKLMMTILENWSYEKVEQKYQRSWYNRLMELEWIVKYHHFLPGHVLHTLLTINFGNP